MSDEDDFGGSIEVVRPDAVLIPFPHAHADEAIAARWDRDRALANTKRQTSYKLRGPLDALDDLIRKRSLPSLPLPATWTRLGTRIVNYAGEMLGITGPTAGGKTSFAIQIARAAIAAGIPVLWLPKELDDVELNLRIVANVHGLHVSVIRTWDRERIARTLNTVADRWHYVDALRDHEAQFDAIEMAIEMCVRVYGKRPVLVADYMGKFARGGKEPRNAVADAIDRFLQITIRTECYTLLLSQTSRANNAKLVGREDLESATDAIGMSAESGELEHACSNVVNLNVFKSDDLMVLPCHALASKARGTGLEGRDGYEFHKPGGVWHELDHLPPTPTEIAKETKKRRKHESAGSTSDVANATGLTRDELNVERQREAAAKRKLAVIAALRAAGVDGLGGRELRKVRGAGDPARLVATLAELRDAGEVEQLENSRWRAIPRA